MVAMKVACIEMYGTHTRPPLWNGIRQIDFLNHGTAVWWVLPR